MAAHNEDGIAQPQSAAGDQPTPTLSVTVLNYNYAHYLPQCLDSILSQTWTDFELILINDCSTDNSLEVIQPYLADRRVKLVNHEQNMGYISSLIEGSELSRGKYLTVISADDFCVSDRAFESLLTLLESDAETAFAHSAFGIYGPEGAGARVQIAQHHDKAYVRSGVEEYPDLLLRRTYVLHSGVIIRSSAYNAVGGYDPSARYACDTTMWLTLCGQGKIAYSPDELFAYRKHETNMSFSPGGIRKGLQEHLAAIERTFAIMQVHPTITRDLYRRAMKRNLSGNAEEAIFAGHMRVGWYSYLCAVRIHPVWTILQYRTAILLARTLMGAQGFHALQHLSRMLTNRRLRRAAYA